MVASSSLTAGGVTVKTLYSLLSTGRPVPT